MWGNPLVQAALFLWGEGRAASFEVPADFYWLSGQSMGAESSSRERNYDFI